MKLIYLNTELDSEKEWELNSDTEFGFNVTVTYKKNSDYIENSSSNTEVCYNCTEVHSRYRSAVSEGKRIAFESDIHSTGCTRAIKEIELVEISIADSKNFNF